MAIEILFNNQHLIILKRNYIQYRFHYWIWSKTYLIALETLSTSYMNLVIQRKVTVRYDNQIYFGLFGMTTAF